MYNGYTKAIPPNMSMTEQAMFMANVIWETGGLQYMEEIACKGLLAPSATCSYSPYHGRGCLQLTWDYNYKAASAAIYGDTRLVDTPTLVSQPEGAWKTAIWFWTSKVQPVLTQNNAVSGQMLGHSVKVINGGIECPAGTKPQPNNRLKIYNGILAAWGISGQGTLTGC